MKDNFSFQSDQYAKFRPVYPQELYDFLIPLVPERITAWDCGTGNGQVALKLADYFEHVFATDISRNQIAHAPTKPNITYRLEASSTTSFENAQFDLITVAQAIHWFDLEKFYKEVRRTLKPAGIFTAIGYSLLRISPEIDVIIDHFYGNILGEYWDEERKLVDDHYESLPFPFDEVESRNFSNTVIWTQDELIGYLNTWSALQHYVKRNGSNPADKVAIKISEVWGDQQERLITFPIFMKIGKI